MFWSLSLVGKCLILIVFSRFNYLFNAGSWCDFESVLVLFL